MNELEQLEQKFGFQYPEIYKQLYQNNMLDWFSGWNEKWTKERNWFTEIYPTLLDNPPLLLFCNDFEMLSFEHIAEEIEAFKAPDDYRQTKPEFQFVPFAMTGAHDLYAFQFDKQKGEDIPVTLVYHDDNAVIKAKNLQDFIFRMLFETVLELNEYSKIDKGNFTANRANILKSHKLYLTETQLDILTEIYSREPFEYKYKVPNGREYSATGLVSRDEFEAILQREIGFEYLNTELDYMG